jgi:Predicted membrane protein
VPSLAHRFVDDTVYNEAVKFVAAVQADPRHPARIAIDGYLTRLSDNLQHDPATIGRLEDAKSTVFDSPRVRELAAEAWNTAKAGLLRSLADPESALRRRAAAALVEIGERLTTDAALQRRVDTWVTGAAVFLVDRYRHDIASIITDTVEKWDAEETTEKIELMVGKDLQYIRLNGTIVGALAGVVIFTVAHALLG